MKASLRVKRINDSRHTRFVISRRERITVLNKPALKAPPQAEFDVGEWNETKLHADCYVSVVSDYYSAPHIHRHTKLEIKSTENHGELLLNLDRLPIHPRCRCCQRAAGAVNGKVIFPPFGKVEFTQETDTFPPVRGARIVLPGDDGIRAGIAGTWLAHMEWDVSVLSATQ